MNDFVYRFYCYGLGTGTLGWFVFALATKDSLSFVLLTLATSLLAFVVGSVK